MSAFYDIWIGNGIKPQHTRGDNAAWQESAPFLGYVSIPTVENRSFLHSHEDATYTMLLIGQLYDTTSIATVLERCKKYITSRHDTFDDPAGHYIIFLKDRCNEKQYVFTNRLGTYHTYWSAINGYGVISTYYMGMAKQSPQKLLNWEGISGFMAMGFFPDDTTYLEGLSVCQPASCYCFDAQLKLVWHERYWNWDYAPEAHTQQEWCTRLDMVLKQTIATALNNKRVALPISGGLDSRTLAGIATQGNDDANASLWAYSYGFSTRSIETAIAGKVAKARHIAFDKYTVDNYLFGMAGTIADSVELFQYIDGTRQAGMIDVLADKTDVVLAGHWGDVWLDDMKMTGITTLKEGICKKIIKKGSERLLTDICKPNFKGYTNVQADYCAAQDDKYKYLPDLDFRMKAYKTDQWSFRWTVPGLRMYQAAVMPVLPFYDKRIVDLFAAIPSDMVKNRELQIAYLKTYHSDLAKITWQEYGNDLYHYKRFNNRNILYRAIKKAQRTLSGKQVRRNWELFYLNEQGRKNLEAILLHNPSFNAIVPAATAQKILNDFYRSSDAANGYIISMLHTFAQFARLTL